MANRQVTPRPSAGEGDSDRGSGREMPPGPPRHRQEHRDRRERRERQRSRDDHRDNRPVPSEIKLKTVTHLLLTDPLRQFSRWHFSVKSHLKSS